ncbi:MAG: alanine racemase [Tissierellales bacterium]|nr:alanine racemase [Tissierellales bacterium]MBN2827729.1 alanine racemase [Tissierellales bacterium]
MAINFRETYAEINLTKLRQNIIELKKITKPHTIFMPVIKANAYGHGSVSLAKEMMQWGIKRFAVAILDEAIELRRAGIDLPILVFGFIPPERLHECIKYQITCTVYQLQTAERLNVEGSLVHQKAIVHLNIDTGMNRLGFGCDQNSIEIIQKISNMTHIVVEGIYTHLATADAKDKYHALKQYEKFVDFLEVLKTRHINIPIKHCSNSAALIDMPEIEMDLVRAGIALYGFYPSADVNITKVHLEPIMTLKTCVSRIAKVQAGEGIGYGRTYVADKPMLVATLPIGYADGYSRGLSNKANVLIHQKKFPIVGNICMDQCMVDITGEDHIKVGDEVVLFGQQGDVSITVDEIAKLLHTINYEVVCMISNRVPRKYVR